MDDLAAEMFGEEPRSKATVTALGVGAAAEQRHGAIGKECGNRTKGAFRVGEHKPGRR